MTDDTDPAEPIKSAPAEVARIIREVLQLERDRLYQKKPKHIDDDIVTIIKGAIE